jgi:DNA-binding SARP family transcriptional activator
LLGPLYVRHEDVEVAVPPRLRALLAALLVQAGRVVPVAELAEQAWNGQPTPGAAVTLRSYVKRLRVALGPDAGGRILTGDGGYVIRVEEGELDLARFESLVRAGGTALRAGAWQRASDLLNEALGLWRGEPLADIPSGQLQASVASRLEQLRLQALEWRIDADLQLGYPARLVPELEALVVEQPFRESFHAQFMLALYRSGRQAEAFAAYRHARRLLVDELGIEPGAELKELHRQMLTGELAHAAGDTGRLAAGATRPVVPRQLPALVPHFAGRVDELRELMSLVDPAADEAPGAMVISAIGGTAGVGKTALAVHWAHQVADRFPDGQLYVNLRGFDPSGTPATPAEAIWGFLDALGVPPGRIPPAPQAQAGLYRSLLADKRMLIVADNARDEQQVRPLLPASPGTLVLVTSRCELAGLAADGARLLTLDVLIHDEAVQLLTARLGAARAAAERAAVGQIARLCAYLPLALAVAAARAAARPGFPLAVLAAELADSEGRLDALDAGDPASSVRAVFSWSTRQLSAEAKRMFGLLGIHPGPDISVPAAASLVGRAQPQSRRLLRELARAHLVAEHLPGRYTFHDLLRAYAAEQALHTGSQADRDAATGRVLDHYLHTAARAARLLMPAKEPVVLAPPRPGAAAGQPADYQQAMAWFEAEHQVLLAIVTLAAGSGFDRHAWQLPWALASFLHTRGHWQEWVATQRAAVAAARRLGDIVGQALSGRLLGMAYTDLGDCDEGRGHLASSLTLYQRLGDRLGQAKVHHNLGFAAECQGRYADALGHQEQALRLYQAMGDTAGEAEALNDVGWCHSLLGDYKQARAFCRQALTLSVEVGYRRIEAHAWDSLGYAEHHLGNLAQAAASYQRALGGHREAGDRLLEADTLTHLGDTRHAAGELAQARETWEQALAILEDIQHPHAGQVRAKLASADAP